MNKLLRFAFGAALALVSSFTMAQTTVTFTPGTDKGTHTGANNDAGEDQVTKDGITIATTNGAFAANQYRVYKGQTFTVTSTAGNITKMVITCTANGTTKQGPGCFDSATAGEYTFDETGKTGTWTGDAATFSLTATSNQVRMTSIEVTVGGTVTPTLGAPTISGNETFTEQTTVTITAAEGATIYYTTDGQDPDDRAGTEYTAPFTLTETATVKAIAYSGDLASSIASKTFTKRGIATTTGEGTVANPYTVADAIAMNAANALPADTAYYTGTIRYIQQVETERYGNATYSIAASTTSADTLYIYRGYYLKAAKFTAADQIKVGDQVVLMGKLINYNGTLELGNRNYIYSLNGKTADNDTPTPTPVTTAANIAAFKALAKDTKAVLTLNDAQVVYTWTSNNGNTSTYVRDATGALLLYNSGLTLNANDMLNGTVNLTRGEYNQAVQATKNDDTNADNLTVTAGQAAQPKAINVADAANYVSDLVIVSGVDVVAKQSGSRTNYYAVSGSDSLQVYNGFHLDGYNVAEATSQTIKGIITQYRSTYEIQPVEDPATTTGIRSLSDDKLVKDEQTAPAYNLAGQRVSNTFKGVVIRNGKKYLNR